MSKQSKQKTQASNKNNRKLSQQEQKRIDQRIKLVHKNHPDCIPILFIKHPQAPNNVKDPVNPFILFQRKAKIQQAMVSLIRQINQKDIYFFCPYLHQDKLKYSALKPGPTIEEIYNKFGIGGYLTLAYSDGNLGMQGMMTMQKWMIRLLVMIILLWVFLYGYVYISNYFNTPNTKTTYQTPKNPIPENNNNTEFEF